MDVVSELYQQVKQIVDSNGDVNLEQEIKESIDDSKQIHASPLIDKDAPNRKPEHRLPPNYVVIDAENFKKEMRT